MHTHSHSTALTLDFLGGVEQPGQRLRVKRVIPRMLPAIEAEPDCALGSWGGPGKPPGHKNLPVHLTSQGYHVSLTNRLTISQLWWQDLTSLGKELL